MAIQQLQLSAVFGDNVVFDVSNNSLNINLNDMNAVGLGIPSDSKPLELLAAIIKRAADAIIVEGTEQLLAQAELSVLAPFSRDGIDRTLFTYSIGFFRNYVSPVFDPEEPLI